MLRVTAPKLGYQFLSCYSFLALIFKIFLLSFADDSETSCHFQPFKTCSCLFKWERSRLHHLKPSQTLFPNFLEFECSLCDYKGAIIFLDLLVIPSVPSGPPILFNLGYAKILSSPMQYF